MTDTAVISTNGRGPSPKAVGVSGIVSYGGVLYHADYDKAWKGVERDKTIGSMLNDPLIGSVLFGIEMLVRRVEWSLQAADESDEAANAAEFVDECLQDMTGYWPGDTLAQILTFLGWGWSCLEVTHKRRDGERGVSPSRFDDGRIGWHKWAIRPQATRYGWEFDGDEPSALIQADPGTFKHYTIPLDKCLLFRYASRDNSPEGTTPLRIAYDAWYYKKQIQKIEAIGIERDLAGLPVYYCPSQDIANNTAVYQAAQNIVTGIRNDSQAGAVISSDRDQSGNRKQELVLLSSGGSRAFDTDAVIKRYANEVVTAFLANVLRTGQDGVGSYALAETQGGLFQQANGAHLDTEANTITEQAIVPLLRMNGFSDALAPTLTHGDIESADLARLGTYLMNLASAGLLEPSPELTVFLHEVAGLPVASVEELQANADKEAEIAAKTPPPVNEDTDATDDEETPQEPVQRATAASGRLRNKWTAGPIRVNLGDTESRQTGEGPLPPRKDVEQADIDGAVALFRKSVDRKYADMLTAEVDDA
jgi:hypothetical protein